MSEAIIADGGKLRVGADWKPYALKVLAGILAFILFAEFAFYAVIIPATTKINLSVKGSSGIGVDELCALTGLSGNEKWISFNTGAVAARLASNPLFEAVSVEKKFPDRVVITLIERVPVAVSFGTVDGRTVPVAIDQNGVVFRVGNIPAGTNLPLVTGLTFENPVAGMRLNPRLNPLLKDLSDLEEKNPVLLSSVSEIKIAQKTYGGYDLVVYPVHTRVRVRTDKALNEAALQYMMLVLDVVKDLSLNIDEIDIRAGTVAYHVKGDKL
jgi:cell division protein FtsQ